MTKNIDADFDLPRQLSVDYYDNYMHVCYTWRSRGTIGLTLFTVIFMIIVGTMYVENFDSFNRKFALIAFIAVFIAGAAFIVYYTIAHWFNKTDIFVNKGQIEVNIGPFPWYGNIKLQTNNITQFYNKRRVKGPREKQRISYEVRYILVNQTDKKLISGIPKRKQAAYIENKIERYLGMENDESINTDDYDHWA